MIPFQKPVKFGLITALIMIVYTVLLYVLDIDIFSIGFSLLNGLVVFGVMIAMTIIGVNKMRDEDLEKKITYVQALLGGFVLLLMAMYISNIFNYILNGLVDPEYLPSKMDGFIANMEGKIPEDQLDEIVAKVQEGIDPMKALVKSIWLSPVISIVVAAIIALFIKKDKSGEIPV